MKGINLLSCLVRYGDIALPISFATVYKDQYFCDVKTKKEKRRSSVTKNQMFRGMVQKSIENGVKFDYVVADSWFGAKDNMEFIHYEKQKMFIFGIKLNRLVTFSKEKGQYQDLNTLDLKDGEKRILYLKGVAFRVAIVKKVFKNEDGSTGTLYLVTNDLDSDAEQIYGTYQKRWRIEEYHKSIKQNASLEKSPTKTTRSQRNHVFASIISYCKLEFLRMKTTLNHFAFKYRLIIRANQAAFQELIQLRKSVLSCA